MDLTKCILCHVKDRYFDPYRLIFRLYCGGDICLLGCKVNTSHYLQPKTLTPYHQHFLSKSQDQTISLSVLCQICGDPAFFRPSTGKYSPGCGYAHNIQAIEAGFTEPKINDK